MRFSSLSPLLGAGLVGLAQASPVTPYTGATSLDTRTTLPGIFNMQRDFLDAILYQGVSAPALPGVQAEVYLGLALPHAQIFGDVSVEVSDKFLIDPTIRVNLGGAKVYLEVDLEASAAVSQSVELFASPRLNLAIPGLLDVELGAAFGLDLLVSVSAAIDVEAGVYLTLPELAFVEINLFTKTICDSNLEGLVAQTLPIALGADVEIEAGLELTLGLRLRTHIGIDAGLDIVGLELGAGADVAVWISLFDYTVAIAEVDGDDQCPISAKEALKVVAGVAIDLDVAVADLLEISLAPSVLVTLATAAGVDVCLPALGTPVGHVITTSTATLVRTSSTSSLLLPVPTNGSKVGGSSNETIGAGGAGSGSGSGSDSGSGSGSGSDSSSGSDVGVYPTSTGAGGSPTGTGGYPASTVTSVPYGNTTTGLGGDVTSTLTTTATYTITSCAASVPNCPASLTQKIITSTVIVKTTVCPATMTTAVSTGSSSASSAPITTPTGAPTTITPCPTPVTSTYTAPSDCPTPVPTVIISDTTTVCPETSTVPTGGAGSTYATLPTGGSAGNYTQIPPMSSAATTPVGTGTPIGTGAYTSARVSPTTPITAGAGRVVGGVAAGVVGIVAALML